jgi:hypothetical protein
MRGNGVETDRRVIIWCWSWFGKGGTFRTYPGDGLDVLALVASDDGNCGLAPVTISVQWLSGTREKSGGSIQVR